MVFNDYSDYGSASGSSSSSSLWQGRDTWPSFQSQNAEVKHKSASNVDVMMRGRSVDDVMNEFRMNGSDSPYNPDDGHIWRPRAGETILGTSPSASGAAGYLRQHSWPAAERAAAPCAAPARPLAKWPHKGFATSTPVFDDPPPFQPTPTPVEVTPVLTEEQRRVLNSLSNDVLYSLIRTLKLDRKKPNQECRFCKNNGERESYYKSHCLKSGGAVACPVLRAFVCRRCGATGDTAHTLKYCPLATAAERLKSLAMMRSVRLASSGRRRCGAPPQDYVVFGDATQTFRDSTDSVHHHYQETFRNSTDSVTQQYKGVAGVGSLDPLWAELERKLML